MKQLFLGIGLQTQDCIPWGNRNQNMSFKFAPVFSLGTLSKLRQKKGEPESSSQRGRNRNQHFSYWACCSFGVGSWKGGSFTERHLQKSTKGFPWILAQILSWICTGQDSACPGQEYLLRFQRCLVLEDIRVQPARVAMLNNSGVQPNLERWLSCLRRTALGLEWGLPWNCHNKYTWSSVHKLPTEQNSTFLKGRPQNLYSNSLRPFIQTNITR